MDDAAMTFPDTPNSMVIATIEHINIIVFFITEPPFLVFPCGFVRKIHLLSILIFSRPVPQ
jgi:hypothetical protein